MSTIWHDMGIRDGKFLGVEPYVFLRECASFFYELDIACRKVKNPSYDPGYTLAQRSYYGHAKHRTPLTWNNSDCKSRFCYKEAPYGVPLAQDVWESPGTEWPKEVLAPSLESVIKEAPVELPLVNYYYPIGCMHTGNLDWQKQLLKLIRAMRYCIIPLTISYQEDNGKWFDMISPSVNAAQFHWGLYRQIRIKIPEYWQGEESAAGETNSFKIGIYARNITPDYVDENNIPPVTGMFWTTDKEYIINVTEENSSSLSELRIYGAVDLSKHPDFRKYFQ